MYRLAACLAALALSLSLVACGEQKATGLPDGPTPEPKPQTEVAVVDNLFVPPQLTVKAGQEVTWVFEGAAPHNVQANDGSFNSHPACGNDVAQCSKAGDPPFKRTFAAAGEIPYFCVIHGTAQGVGMAGTIIVTA